MNPADPVTVICGLNGHPDVKTPFYIPGYSPTQTRQKYKFLPGWLIFVKNVCYMKRNRRLHQALYALIFLVSCHPGSKNSQSGHVSNTLVQINHALSDTLLAKLNLLVNTYYTLKDAFVKSDTVAADEAAVHLLENTDSIHLQELQADSLRFKQAQSSLQSMGGEIAGLLGENTLKGKRMEFQMISDIVYDLIKATGMKGQTVYRDFCPMFNDGNGAYWLSNSEVIHNPYYGQDMLGCGEIRETLKF